MNEVRYPAELADDLSVETFLESARDEFSKYTLTPEQVANLALGGRALYRPVGYLEQLFAADTDPKVTPQDRLLDAFVSGVVLEVPEISEKAEVLLGESRSGKELTMLLLFRVGHYCRAEKQIGGMHSAERLGRLKNVEYGLSERLRNEKRREKIAKKAGKEAAAGA